MEWLEIDGVVALIMVDIAVAGMTNAEDAGVDGWIGVIGGIWGGNRWIGKMVEQVIKLCDQRDHGRNGRIKGWAKCGFVCG